MTNVEAAALLGVQEAATPDQIRRRYEELHNDFQIRLTNAPTPALKKTYQKNLQELREAVEVLAPGATSGGMPDLPSAEPVDGRSDDIRSGFATRPVSRPARAQDVEAPAGLAKSTIVAIVAAALFAGLSAFLGLSMAKQATTEEQLTARLASVTNDLQRQVKTYSALEYADQLRVRNASRQTLKIAALSVTYLDKASGELKTVHSGTYDYHMWEIRPGEVQRVDGDIGRGRDWDGPVVFYSLVVEYPNVEPFLKSGAWTRDIDTREKVLPLALD